MTNPKVSVILPFYNAELTLGRAIESILNQSFNNFELILIDNNSSDRSTEIAHQYVVDKRVIIQQERMQGISYAANKGISLSIGEYIARMDADDYAHPTRLELQVNHLDNNHKIDISASQVNYIPSIDTDNAFSNFVEWSNLLCISKEIFKNRFVEFPIVNPSLTIRKSVYDLVGLFHHGDFPEDYEWFLRACENRINSEKILTTLLDWHDGSNRLTRQDDRYRTDAFFDIKTKYLVQELKRLNQKEVWIWGAGKLGIKRSKQLIEYGIKICGYIDIKKKSLVQYTCIEYDNISLPVHPFIISYVTNRNVREEIREHLNNCGYTELKNYIIAG
ncbi:MAG: glycosyltransferase family 2 protein [Reichenbachiella sp.]